MLRQPPLQSKLIQPPHPLTSRCFLLPPRHGIDGGGPDGGPDGGPEGDPEGDPEGGPEGGPDGGPIPLHIGALVVHPEQKTTK